MKIKKIIISSSVILNIILFLIIFSPVTSFLYKPLIVDENIKNCEIGVILSASGYSSTLLDFSSLTRLQKGLELYRAGVVQKLICIGGIKLGDTTIAKVMKKTLILYGVNSENIFIEDSTSNTYLDIISMRNMYGNQFNFNEAIFITSSYHTGRVKSILNKMKIKGIVVSAEKWELNPRLCSERFLLFRNILREYGAICYFTLKGWI